MVHAPEAPTNTIAPTTIAATTSAPMTMVHAAAPTVTVEHSSLAPAAAEP